MNKCAMKHCVLPGGHVGLHQMWTEPDEANVGGSSNTPNMSSIRHETADAHQALALATEKATDARRDLVRGLDEMRSAAVALDLDDLADTIGSMTGEAIVATMGFAGIRVDVIAELSLRIAQHRTHEAGVLA